MLSVTIFATILIQSFALHRDVVLKPFVEGKAFKVISGLNNFDRNVVKNVAWAAENGGASHVDIACTPELVTAAKSVCGLPICVSSIKPNDFVAAVAAGADMIEIGNFDSFYSQGLQFTAEDVLSMTKETRNLLPHTPLSVTIPHALPLDEQIILAKNLETIGVDIIQTEGKFSANVASMGVQELIEIAAPTIAAAFAISRAVKIPVMCASGLTDVTVPLALAAGARGVGVGSTISKQRSLQQMLLAVEAIAASMGRSPSPSTTSKEIINQIAGRVVQVQQDVQQ